jgi:hypothetical protein
MIEMTSIELSIWVLQKTNAQANLLLHKAGKRRQRTGIVANRG